MVADNQMAKVILSGSKPSKKKGKETLAQRDWFWTVEPVSTTGDMLQAFDVKVATSEKRIASSHGEKAMYRNSLNRSQGFTLIEVLVAIAIFASLSVGAYQVLNQVQRSNEISMERSERLKTLQRALVFMDNDFRQMALRQARTNGEEPSPMLLQWKGLFARL